MKWNWKEIGISVIMGCVLPGILLSLAVGRQEKPLPVPAATQSQQQQEISIIRRNEDGTTVQIPLSEYLVGVVLAEMPADFEPEALKAQAVVARTYTLKAKSTGGKHSDGSVCTEPSCCQGWIEPDSYLRSGGTGENIEKIRKAVLDTAGYVLTYEGELIEATYFSCSGGSTEDAVAVWGRDFPYLRSVESPGEAPGDHYTDTVSFTPREFAQAMDVSLSGNPETWFGYTTYTAGGGVNSMIIGGKEYKGTELRSLLKLRSTAFSVEVQDGTIFITTKGYGHRVGMSQYGADAMAAEGRDFSQILAHYYRGAVLTQWEN